MKSKLLMLMFLAGLTLYASGVTTASKPVVSSKTASGVVSTKKAGFNIPDGAELTVTLLDDCWNNREDLKNQKIIADYLMTQPKVPNNYEIAWKTARLVYFIGNFGLGDKRFVSTDEGVTLFDYGAKAGRLAEALEPAKVEGHFWYAINLGSYGLAKGILSSASNAKYGMEALKKARVIDPTYQGYGSSRILGRYYQELPGMFGGDSDKAFQLLKEAVDKAPKYRKNWLFLGKYYLDEGKYKEASDVCTKAVNLPAAEGKFEELRYVKEAKQCLAKAQSKLN